jgi:hypothetical protein
MGWSGVIVGVPNLLNGRAPVCRVCVRVVECIVPVNGAVLNANASDSQSVRSRRRDPDLGMRAGIRAPSRGSTVGLVAVNGATR